ncbi:MAG: hypothetical protein WC866_05335 [Patescibacteria group bacterium]|jgi:hypothetical protein
MKIHPSMVPKHPTHIKWNLGVNDDARDSDTSTNTGIGAGVGGSTETM